MIKILLFLSIFLTGCAQKYIIINNQKIFIEIADTEEKKVLGLSGRKNLCKNCGMLFVFDKPGIYTFWMKGMNFPIDIIFINDDEIVEIKEKVIPESYPSLIISNNPFDKALEINAGESSKFGFNIGTVVKYNP